MSTTRFEGASEASGPLVEAAWKLQQRLLEDAQSLLVTLERPGAAWAVEDDVRGYTWHLGPGRLEASEREAMCESLHQDIQTLQQLAERLAQLRCGGVTSYRGAGGERVSHPEPPDAPDPPSAAGVPPV